MTANETRYDPVETVVLDVDGTLVDTVYHHTIAWSYAFGEAGVDVPVWRIHRAIGMGGDRLVTEVAGQEVEDRVGDDLRAGHGSRFAEMIDEIRPLPGAEGLLAELRRRGLKVVLASSGEAEQIERLLTLVAGTEHAHDWTTSSEVTDSKPAPDLIEVALEKVGGGTAAVVGDAVWDIRAARTAGLSSIGLLCGGFGEGELREAGADAVFATPADLCAALDDTVLSGRR